MTDLSTHLTIEKMIYGGDGLARVPDPSGKNQAVFLPFVLPGEQVLARIKEQRGGFARAQMDEVTVASPRRTTAHCPYFQRCGGCHYQHADYGHQLEIKGNILRETLARTARFEWPQAIPTHSGQPWNYRNRTRLKVSATPDFAIGYFRVASHELLPVEECPISSPLINRALAALWRIGRKGQVPHELREIELFSNAEDDALLLEIYLVEQADDTRLADFAGQLTIEVPELTGIAAFRFADKGAPKSFWGFGTTELIYRTFSDGYRVSAGSFFQTNRHLTDTLVRVVIQEQKGEIALDLYAGTGLFSLPLSRSFDRVIAVESGPASFADLRANALKNVECHRSATEDFLKRPMRVLPEFVVVDPPRSGLGDKVTASLNQLAPARIAYVSCDPATLARDLRGLLLGGYKVRSIDLVDLFPQTFHIETVVHLVR